MKEEMEEKRDHSRIFPPYAEEFLKTDPEFMQRVSHFAFDEVVNQGSLNQPTRFMAVMAALIGAQLLDEFRALLPVALENGVTPVQAKEVVYQAAAYCGLGQMLPFLKATNDLLLERGVALPLPPMATDTPENRQEAGNEIQVQIYGEGKRGSYAAGPEERRHLNRWVTKNCFGDYFARDGLTYRERLMLNLCFIAAMGGCSGPLTNYAEANLRAQNDKVFLIDVLSQCLPYIGYPRVMEALAQVEAAAARLSAE